MLIVRLRAFAQRLGLLADQVGERACAIGPIVVAWSERVADD